MSKWEPRNTAEWVRGTKKRLDYIERIISSSVPSGTVQLTAAAQVPNGWLLANGAAVSRATFERLFSAIGTTYGAGNGTTTFTLPNMAAVNGVRYIIKA